MFSKKLDFLMNLTNTHNVALATAINIDASAVSRLRNGKRSLPKYHDFLPQMALYFAARLTEDYQKRAAADQIAPNRSWPEDIADASNIICLWLLSSDELQLCSIERLISEIADLNSPTYDNSPAQVRQANAQMSRFFYGEQGFRDSILAFMDTVIADGHPRELLMFCEENPGWLANDRFFADEWSKRFGQALQLGCTVKIIHNSTHSIDEMLEGIAWWLPLYLTGAVVPYYYPKICDNQHKRSLFVASGLAALQTTVVGKRGYKDLVQLIDDPHAVSSLEYEYTCYLSKCSPLTELLQNDESFVLAERLIELERQRGDSIIAHLTPALSTMPIWVMENICQRSGSDRLLRLRQILIKSFMENIEDYIIYELIYPPAEEHIAEGRIPVLLSELLGSSPAYYTLDEYVAHIENIIELSDLYPNYHIMVTDSFAENIVLFCKKNAGVILARAGTPPISLVLTHQNTADAFSEYLQRLYTHSKLNAKSQLQKLVDTIKQSCH